MMLPPPPMVRRGGGVAAQMTAEGRIFACNRRSRGMGLEEDEERSNRRPLGWLSARYCGRNAVTLLSPCPLLLTRFVMLSRRDPPSGNHRTGNGRGRSLVG